MIRQKKHQPSSEAGESAGQPHRIGRVAFVAVLDIVKTELTQGWSARAIFARHADKLAGRISYPQFNRYIRQLRAEGLGPPLPAAMATLAAAPPPAPIASPRPPIPPPPSPIPPQQGSDRHAGHPRPGHAPIFDPQTRPGDRRRLLDETEG